MGLEAVNELPRSAMGNWKQRFYVFARGLRRLALTTYISHHDIVTNDRHAAVQEQQHLPYEPNGLDPKAPINERTSFCFKTLNWIAQARVE
jgi:hypothetical protein